MDEFNDKKFVIKLGDKEWEVKYDFTSFLEIEDKYDSLTDVFFLVGKKRFKIISDLLYISLKNTNPDFLKKYKDFKDFVKDLDTKKINEYDELVAEALKEAFPQNLLKKE